MYLFCVIILLLLWQPESVILNLAIPKDMIGNGIDCSLKELVKVINLFDQCDYNKGGRDNKL